MGTCLALCAVAFWLIAVAIGTGVIRVAGEWLAVGLCYLFIVIGLGFFMFGIILNSAVV